MVSTSKSPSSSEVDACALFHCDAEQATLYSAAAAAAAVLQVAAGDEILLRRFLGLDVDDVRFYV